MASNTATAVATTLIGAACGLLGGLALGNRGNESSRSGIETAAPHQQAAPFEATALESRLDELRSDLAMVKSLVAGQAVADDRVPVITAAPAPSSSESAIAEPDPDRFRAIELELAAIRQTIKEQVWIQSPPTYEQVQGAADTVWPSVKSFIDTCNADLEAARASVLGHSYGEVLSRFGRPTIIQATKWSYMGKQAGGGFWLEFVNGYVGGLQVFM